MSAQRNHEELAEADVREMLASIPSDDRVTWVRVAGAVKHQLGDGGFSLWDEWSQSSDKYRAADARAVWKSIRHNTDRPATIATVIHLAREYGYRPDNPLRKPRPRPQQAPQQAAQESPTLAYALRLWMACDRSNEAVRSHPYAIAKGIDWHAGAGRVQASARVIGRDSDCLVVPIRENATGRVQGVQCINAEGQKQTFGTLSGGALLLGNDLDKRIPWAVVEGWADAVTFVWHWHKGNAAAVCSFGVGRMDDLATFIDKTYGPREVLVIYDADQEGKL